MSNQDENGGTPAGSPAANHVPSHAQNPNGLLADVSSELNNAYGAFAKKLDAAKQLHGSGPPMTKHYTHSV